MGPFIVTLWFVWQQQHNVANWLCMHPVHQSGTEGAVVCFVALQYHYINLCLLAI